MGIVNEVLKAFDRTQSVKATAKETGCSWNRVVKILSSNGIIINDTHKLILRLKKEGKTVSEIAKETGHSEKTVSAYLPAKRPDYNTNLSVNANASNVIALKKADGLTEGEKTSVNTRIKEVRKTNHLTLEEFGRRIGVARTTISNIERGYRKPSGQMVKFICREFGYSEEWLNTGAGPKLSADLEKINRKYVEELLSTENPTGTIILSILKVYSELDKHSKQVADEIAYKIITEIKKSISDVS